VATHGLLDQKIDRALADLKGHQHPAAAEVALGRKAVFAAQVTVVRYVQAHGFDRGIPQHIAELLVLIFGIQQAGTIQLEQLLIGLVNFGFRESPEKISFDLLRLLFRYTVRKRIQHQVGQLIKHMNCSTVGIEDNVISVQVIFVYHISFSIRTKWKGQNSVPSII